MSSSVSPDQERLFEEIYAEYVPRVYRVFVRRFPDLAEDLTQAVFLSVYRIMRERSFDHDGLVRYLWKSARHRLLDAVRDEHRRLSNFPIDDGVDSEEVAMSQQGKEPRPEARLLGREMLDLVGRLSPQQKQCALLRGEGYRGHEIAAILGVSLNTVKTHLRLAREKLDRWGGRTVAAEEVP